MIEGVLSDMWFVGAGNMGKALLTGWLACGLNLEGVTVIDPALPKLPAGLNAVAEPPLMSKPPAILVLGVKPQMLRTVAKTLRPLISPETLVLSMLAGTRASTLAELLKCEEIVRVMPNLPVAIRKGAISLFSSQASCANRLVAERLLCNVGHTEWLASEDLLDAATALGGSGPAFVYRFIDALSRAAVDLGLPSDQATRIALSVVSGAAEYLVQSGSTPNELTNDIASVAGTTRAGLVVLDENESLNGLMIQTLLAAALRSKELSQDTS